MRGGQQCCMFGAAIARVNLATSPTPSLGNMLAAILFDLDGTLVDTDPAHFQAWQTLLREDYDLEIDIDYYHRHFNGRTNAEIIGDILPRLSPAERLHLADTKEARFRAAAGDLQALAGFNELFDRLRAAGLKAATVTNAPRANAEFLLAALGLSTAFDTVVLAEEASAGKPDPAPYKLALERLGLESKVAIAFEDSPSGVKAAVAAGLATIGITTTRSPADLLAAGACSTRDDYSDPQLWAWLQTLIAG